MESTMKNHAPGESFSERIAHVLNGIVRIGFYDGRGNPEDNMLPSVMRTLLEYLGDDCGLPGLGQEPVTRWQWSACALMHRVREQHTGPHERLRGRRELSAHHDICARAVPAPVLPD
jgi:hypothetical protein